MGVQRLFGVQQRACCLVRKNCDCNCAATFRSVNSLHNAANKALLSIPPSSAYTAQFRLFRPVVPPLPPINLPPPTTPPPPCLQKCRRSPCLPENPEIIPAIRLKLTLMVIPPFKQSPSWHVMTCTGLRISSSTLPLTPS